MTIDKPCERKETGAPARTKGRQPCEREDRRSSRRTARNQVPGALRRLAEDVLLRRTNLDWGGGPYDTASIWLQQHGILNYVYDPFNRADCHNQLVVNARPFGSGTCLNVLNVIQSAWKRRETLGRLAGLVTGPVYVGVYEGDGSSVGAETRDGWQANAKLEHFLPAIKADFPEAQIFRISGDCRTSVQLIMFKGRFADTQSLRGMELVIPQELR